MKDKMQDVPKVNITSEMISNSQTIKCECGGMVFTEKMIFKKLSALLSPSGKEEFLPLNAMICESCGKIPSIFDPTNIFPKELKATKLTI
jgi:hypothetical protein